MVLHQPKKPLLVLEPTPIKKQETTPQVSEEETPEAEDPQETEAVAKVRKNERERQRRLAMSSGFEDLSNVLKLGRAAQHDKVSILRTAVDRIKELEGLLFLSQFQAQQQQHHLQQQQQHHQGPPML